MKTDEQGRPLIPSSEELSALPADGGPDWNRLVFEKSPYLLQHAANRVDWYPWGEEAFARAKELDKPVFLSVGYTTCHWCHVMERESFEDDEVADLLNEAFVCIKVDREERPDIDNVYMTVTQAMTGQGGWPMTVAMTADRRPFFAGTYFPKFGRYGRPGMMELIPGISQHWKQKRDELLTSADKITEAVAEMTGGNPGGEVSEALLSSAVEQLESRFDEEEGGFGGSPKFPVPHNLSYLIRAHWRTGEPRPLEMAQLTLAKMRRGGVYDQVGFGLHRYSTDQYWLLPHFEKMLYDQAMMLFAFIDAHQATGEEEEAGWAREICTYVLRDMTSEEGGFYSAEDADSEGEEGKFYVWNPKEIKTVLGEEEGDLFCRVFNIEEGGNFFEEATKAPTGDSIPHLQKTWNEFAENLGLGLGELRKRIDASRSRLFAHREKRIHPQKDDKILTDWNGLMIAALARAGRILGESRYLEAAEKAARFLLTTLRDDEGRLLKRYRSGEAGLPGHLDDYAFSVWGLIELYQSTYDANYLKEAIDLNQRILDHFDDPKGGGFFLTADDGESLLVRSKVVFDNAYPSGNSAAAFNLVRLARMTGRFELEERAASILDGFSKMVEEIPSAHTHLLSALEVLVGPAAEVVIAGESGKEDTRAMIEAVRGIYSPHLVVLFRPTEEENPLICTLAPSTRDQVAIDGRATAYFCRKGACERPVTEVEALVKQIEALPKG